MKDVIPPIFCPVMGLLALAFADNAFKVSGLGKPEDLFSLTIPHFTEPLAFQWSPEGMQTPIFRRQVNGVICNSTAWAYTDFNHCLKRLGFLAGYPQDLGSYAQPMPWTVQYPWWGHEGLIFAKAA